MIDAKQEFISDLLAHLAATNNDQAELYHGVAELCYRAKQDIIADSNILLWQQLLLQEPQDIIPPAKVALFDMDEDRNSTKQTQIGAGTVLQLNSADESLKLSVINNYQSPAWYLKDITSKNYGKHHRLVLNFARNLNIEQPVTNSLRCFFKVNSFLWPKLHRVLNTTNSIKLKFDEQFWQGDEQITIKYPYWQSSWQLLTVPRADTSLGSYLYGLNYPELQHFVDFINLPSGVLGTKNSFQLELNSTVAIPELTKEMISLTSIAAINLYPQQLSPVVISKNKQTYDLTVKNHDKQKLLALMRVFHTDYKNIKQELHPAGSAEQDSNSFYQLPKDETIRIRLGNNYSPGTVISAEAMAMDKNFPNDISKLNDFKTECLTNPELQLKLYQLSCSDRKPKSMQQIYKQQVLLNQAYAKPQKLITYLRLVLPKNSNLYKVIAAIALCTLKVEYQLKQGMIHKCYTFILQLNKLDMAEEIVTYNLWLLQRLWQLVLELDSKIVIDVE